MEDIFKDNPSLDVAYKTADGKYFYTHDTAKNYAQTLENKEVIRLEAKSHKQEASPLQTPSVSLNAEVEIVKEEIPSAPEEDTRTEKQEPKTKKTKAVSVKPTA